MPEQDVKAGKLNKAEEVLDVVFPSGDQVAELVHPSEEPFHSPTPTDSGVACVRPESDFDAVGAAP